MACVVCHDQNMALLHVSFSQKVGKNKIDMLNLSVMSLLAYHSDSCAAKLAHSQGCHSQGKISGK